MTRLTVGIIGCGRMGRERAQHAAAYGADVVAYDAQSGRALELAGSTPRCRPVSSEAAIPWDELDAVFLCTPPAYRRELLERALFHEVAVFTEKPFATSYAEAHEMASSIHEAGVIAAVGYMNRYRESVRLSRELLQRFAPVAIAAYWTCGRYAVPWWQHPEISGGPFNEQATHLVDLLRCLGGEINDVRAVAVGESRVAAALRLGSACTATLLYSCDAKEKHIGIEVITAEGRLRLSGWDFALSENTIDGRTCAAGENPFATETREFLDAVTGNTRASISCTPADAAATQAAVDAIRAAYSAALTASAV